jgi:hypothetical protein
MYKVYNISYDLHKPGKDYNGLIKELQNSHTWWHYLESTWLIYTNETANQIWNRLSSYLDQNDSILIIETGKDYSGWLPKEAWEWIKKQIG